MEESIFTKIVKGEIPAHKVYEDEKTLAFLPLRPIAKGHVLVIPKAQVDQFFDLADEDYDALWESVRKVAKRMKEVLHTKRVGLQVVGLDVPHAHVHVIAFDSIEEYRQHEEDVVVPDEETLAAIASKLSF